MDEQETLQLLMQSYEYLEETDPDNELLQGMSVVQTSEGKTLHVYNAARCMRKYDGMSGLEVYKKYGNDMAWAGIRAANARVAKAIEQLKVSDPNNPILGGLEITALDSKQFEGGIHFGINMDTKHPQLRKYDGMHPAEVSLKLMYELEEIVSGDLL